MERGERARAASTLNPHLKGPERLGSGFLQEERPDVPWEMDPYEIDWASLKKVGSGVLGEVYKTEWRGMTVAVKRLHKDIQDNIKAYDVFKEQTQRLQGLSHPNVVPVLAVCSAPGFLSTVTPFLDSAHVGHRSVPTHFHMSKNKKLALLLDIARGMLFLHSQPPQPIIHRHLKAENILVMPGGQLAVSDYGLSRLVQFHHEDDGTSNGDGHEKVTERIKHYLFRGTPDPDRYWTMAPEVFKHEHYTSKADVYSFAIVMNEIFEGVRVGSLYNPQAGAAEAMAANAAYAGARPNITENLYPRGALDLMKECWDSEPDRRPHFAHIVQRIEESIQANALVEAHGEGMKERESSSHCVIA